MVLAFVPLNKILQCEHKIQIKATVEYFLVVMFVMATQGGSTLRNPESDHSNESY